MDGGVWSFDDPAVGGNLGASSQSPARDLGGKVNRALQDPPLSEALVRMPCKLPFFHYIDRCRMPHKRVRIFGWIGNV
jgi:hypothetical protein